jgi:uncharacterized membrane protein YgcG
LAAPPIPNVPEEGKYMIDCAKVVTPNTVEIINVSGKNLYNNKKVKVFVVTVETLTGMSIQDYANELQKQWTRKDSTLKDSVVIVYAHKENVAYIVPGDGVSKLNARANYGQYRRYRHLWQFGKTSYAEAIVKDEMQPAFKAGDCDNGLGRGYSAVAT